MKTKFAVIIVSAFVLAACDTPAQTVGLGAGIGAVGAAAVGANPLTGAVVGAGVGAVCELAEGCN